MYVALCTFTIQIYVFWRYCFAILILNYWWNLYIHKFQFQNIFAMPNFTKYFSYSGSAFKQFEKDVAVPSHVLLHYCIMNTIMFFMNQSIWKMLIMFWNGRKYTYNTNHGSQNLSIVSLKSTMLELVIWNPTLWEFLHKSISVNILLSRWAGPILRMMKTRVV